MKHVWYGGCPDCKRMNHAEHPRNMQAVGGAYDVKMSLTVDEVSRRSMGSHVVVVMFLHSRVSSGVSQVLKLVLKIVIYLLILTFTQNYLLVIN